MFGLEKLFGSTNEEEANGYPIALTDQEEAVEFLTWLAEERERALRSFEPEPEEPRHKLFGLF